MLRLGLCFLISCASATELTVGPAGFKTIGEGVAALKAGDTLTIKPGEYRETVSATLVGTAEAPITIRAWRAGSVLMRGDVELGDFKAAPELRDVFVTEMKQKAESVFERSTFRTLEPKMSAAEVETSLMSYHQDEKNGLLLDFKDFIPAKDNPLSKASDGKLVGLEPEQGTGKTKAP